MPQFKFYLFIVESNCFNAMPNTSGQPSTRLPVITGLGIVSAAGFGVEEVWRAVASGTSGLKPLTLFQSPRYGQVVTGDRKSVV